MCFKNQCCFRTCQIQDCYPRSFRYGPDLFLILLIPKKIKFQDTKKESSQKELTLSLYLLSGTLFVVTAQCYPRPARRLILGTDPEELVHNSQHSFVGNCFHGRHALTLLYVPQGNSCRSRVTSYHNSVETLRSKQA